MIKKLVFTGLTVLAVLFIYTNNSNSDTDELNVNYQKYLNSKIEKKKAGIIKYDMPEEHARIEREIRTPDDLISPTYSGNYRVNEYIKRPKREKSNNITFTERGPGNVAGRTRAVLNFSEDFTFSTWLIGSASGGIWKTTNGGETWENKTANLPNLGFNTLAHSPANENIVYAGTGEHFTNDLDGTGMFKSADGGDSWVQIASPEDYVDFRNVSRIVVDPEDPNVVIATTRNSVWARTTGHDGFLDSDLQAAIYKSTDGGMTWERKLSSTEDRYDHIVADPTDFNTLYVAINGIKVVKSIDGGETWADASAGLARGGRAEIGISPVNPQRLWLSTQGNLTGTGSDLYVSSNGADSWELVSAPDGVGNVHFLAGQGWYDNTVAAHPHNEDIIYVGAVNLWKFTLTGDSIASTRFEPFEDGTEEFLDLINFGGAVGNGGIDLGEDLTPAEINPVEIRFGQGGQMAHRFTVNGRGSGVPASDYEYEDLVEIPFQVWDTELDRQLMVSFRDQQNDTIWNLIPELTDNAVSEENSREYIFIHNVDYTDTTDVNIAVSGGGHEYRNMYFLWPVLADNSPYTDNDFPESNFRIDKNSINALGKNIETVSDAYNEFSGINRFVQNNRTSSGIHPDHHNIFILNDVPNRRQFRLLVGSDGGMFVSRRSSNPGVLDDAFSYASLGNNTTQFYSADKAPGVDRYIGGMQDNGTWFTPSGMNGSASTPYRFALGGDGFEAIWNNRNSDLIIAGSQFNNFSRTINGGTTWNNATNGIDDSGPFWSQLENSKNLPDRIFTIGSSGAWKSNDFGGTWTPTRIDDPRWSFNSSMSIEVSIADYNTVWAGGALSENRRFFVSTDGGDSYKATNYYQDQILGRSSGLSTHPTDPETAYAMFSYQGRPKILKTTDLGENWEDISGFAESEDGSSTRGFPDVAVNKVFVFPNDTSRIWAGTEIGIVESLDGGASWAIMDNEMGAINVYDMILQDDQIVIATYGRGIWTATVEGIEQEVIFPPLIASSFVAPNGELKLQIEYNAVFDSSILLLNGDTIDQITINTEGTEEFLLDNPMLEGVGEFQVIGYLDGREYPSIIFSVALFIPIEPAIEYFNDFSDSTRHGEFSGNGFSIYTEEFFDDDAIHSLHPHPNSTELVYVLTQPIQIKGQQFLNYDNVAIIEPGEPGTVYGDNQFWDYVIVEGSIDGENWIELLDGYDARADPDWEFAYVPDGVAGGRQGLYRPQQIDLSQFFTKDDIVLIRFRLFADAGVFAWGWAIDNVQVILDNTTPTIDIVITENKIYPSITSGPVTVTIDGRMELTNLSVYNLNGRVVLTKSIDGLDQYQFDISTQSSGYYLVELSNGVDNVIQKIIKE